MRWRGEWFRFEHLSYAPNYESHVPGRARVARDVAGRDQRKQLPCRRRLRAADRFASETPSSLIVITFFVAPPDAPQVYKPPLNGVEHPLAPMVMNAMLRYGTRPVGLWRVIN